MSNDLFHVMQGDCLELLKTLPAKSVDSVVTSPPYWNMRDYQIENQMGMEPTMGEYIDKLVNVFREIRRVLVDTGNAWLNLGDGYSGSGRGPGGLNSKEGSAKRIGRLFNSSVHEHLPPKNITGIPWRVAFALQDDGWILRQDIIWSKGNCMPESVTDRCTKSHEYIFLLAKQGKYYFDHAAIQEPAIYPNDDRKGRALATHKRMPTAEVNGIRPRANPSNSFARKTQTTPPPGQPTQHREDREAIEYSGTRNKRSVWECNVSGYPGAHFATFPMKLIEPCILAGCPVGGLVLDPFSGTATTGAVAVANGRRYLGMELNPDYIKMSYARIRNVNLPLFAK